MKPTFLYIYNELGGSTKSGHCYHPPPNAKNTLT